MKVEYPVEYIQKHTKTIHLYAALAEVTGTSSCDGTNKMHSLSWQLISWSYNQPDAWYVYLRHNTGRFRAKCYDV